MKRVVLITAVAVIAVFATTLTGCEALLAMFLTPVPPATPVEQVEGFLAAASVVPQDNETLRAYFDTDAAQYVSMLLDTYWEARFFNVLNGPYEIPTPEVGAADAEFAGSVTVTGNVTNSINTDVGYAVVFVLTTDPTDSSADPLIRKITVTVADTDEVIEKVIP